MVCFMYVDARKDRVMHQRGLWKSFKAFVMYVRHEEPHFVRERRPWTSTSGMWMLGKAYLCTKEVFGNRSRHF